MIPRSGKYTLLGLETRTSCPATSMIVCSAIPDRMTGVAQKGIPTTVLVAPDSFKGTLTAGEVAARDRPGDRGGPAVRSTYARWPTAGRGRWRC